MATNKFVIEVKASGFTGLQEQVKKSSDALDGFERSSTRMRRGTKGLERSIGKVRNTLLLYAFAAGVATKATSSFVRNASRFQDVRTRLVGLTGSVVEANKAFDIFNRVAATTPFSLDDVVNAGAQLQAFGADANQLIGSITDLASFMGTTAVEAANAFGRAFAGGAGAADILRERGILNIIKTSQGLTDLSKTTLPQFREALIRSIQDPVVGISGSSERLSRTFSGTMSNMRDSITRLTASIGSLALPAFQSMAKGIGTIAQQVERIQRNLTETQAQKTLRMLKEIGVEAEALTQLEITVFREQTSKNLERINKEIGKLLDRNSDLGVSFKKLGGDFDQQVGVFEVFRNAFLHYEKDIKNVTIGNDDAKNAITQLKLELNNIIASARGSSESNELLVESLNEEALAIISLISLLQQGVNENLKLDNAIKQLTETFKVNTSVVTSYEAALAEIGTSGRFALKSFERFGDAFAEAALTATSFEDAAKKAIRSIAAEIVSKAGTFALLRTFFAPQTQGLTFGKFLLGSLGIKHDGGPVQKFQSGGIIQGRDNVPILAQAGEFVIKRDSAQSIGLDTLNQMNQTGTTPQSINITIQGGIVQEDYIRNTLVPAIAETGVRLARS